MTDSVRIGTRGSALALWQAEWVRTALQRLHPGLAVGLHTIKTQGDKILDVPLAKVGGKGLFVKEIEEALVRGEIDLAVHSMKDMPAAIPEGLAIGAVPERESPADVLISRLGLPLADLPQGARIGTSSLRRAAQVRHLRPDLAIVPLRGNLDTRLRKLDTEGLDGIMLAEAGVKRLGLSDRITQVLPFEGVLPAVGQGALCLEIRAGDPRVRDLLHPLEHSGTRRTVTAERAFLHRLQGGCQVPIAGHGRLESGRLLLEGMVAEPDGSVVIRDTVSGPPEEDLRLGIDLAERLLSKGAGEILDKLQAEAV